MLYPNRINKLSKIYKAFYSNLDFFLENVFDNRDLEKSQSRSRSWS
jgi:hypothetical protein